MNPRTNVQSCGVRSNRGSVGTLGERVRCHVIRKSREILSLKHPNRIGARLLTRSPEHSPSLRFLFLNTTARYGQTEDLVSSTMALKQNIRQAEGVLRSVPDPGQIAYGVPVSVLVFRASF